MKGVLGVLLILLVFLLYFLPYLVGRKKKNATSILILNFFFGWSVIGWVVALVWATTKEDLNLKKCPKCAEEVKAEAQICRFCGFNFPLTPTLDAPPSQPAPTQKKFNPEVRDLAADYINRMKTKNPSHYI